MAREKRKAEDILFSTIDAAVQDALVAGVSPDMIAWTLREHAERLATKAKGGEG